MGVYEKLITLNDGCAKDSMERQMLEPDHRFFGGVIEPGLGIASPSHWGTALHIAHWTAALVNPDSPLYRNEDLLRSLEAGLRFMLRSQHGDGTISPPWTNMHSPPDTAFVVGGLAQVHACLVRETAEWPFLEEAEKLLRRFLEQSIPAMLTGGCHTPNHRWILTSALGFLYKLTGQEELRERALDWLAEGMDITEDGEWTERSNGIYNSVSDIALIYAAEQLDMPELLEPVRKNLRMMAYLVHPNGDVVTDYSGRQDFGDRHHLGSYFVPLRIMAEHDGDSLLAALSELAASQLEHPGGLPCHSLIALLLRPELRELSVTPEPLPDSYRVLLNGDFERKAYVNRMADAGHHGVIYHSKLHPDFGAPVARIRSGVVSATVMTENPSFFAVRNGAAALLAIQVASVFQPGYVRMNTLVEQEGGYRLKAAEKKGYYGPVPRKLLPNTAQGPVSPWYLLPHQHREVTHEQTHQVEVNLTETASGWRVEVCCDYEAPILTTVSFVFPIGGSLSGDGIRQEDSQARLWTEGTVRFAAGEDGKDWIQISGGALQHGAKGINNAPHPAGCQTLLVNLVTPYRHVFEIVLSGK